MGSLASLVDLGGLSALINIIAALVCLILMQALTRECGIKTKHARIRLVHRLSFAALAIALMANALVGIENDSEPRAIDLMVQLAYLGVVAVSAWRHHVAKVMSLTMTSTPGACEPNVNDNDRFDFPLTEKDNEKQSFGLH